MARDNPLHDNPRSKKVRDEQREAKKGDTHVDEEGETWESYGTLRARGGLVEVPPDDEFDQKEGDKAIALDNQDFREGTKKYKQKYKHTYEKDPDADQSPRGGTKDDAPAGSRVRHEYWRKVKPTS